VLAKRLHEATLSPASAGTGRRQTGLEYRTFVDNTAHETTQEYQIRETRFQCSIAMVGDSTTTVRVFLSRHPRRYLCRYPLCESPGIGQTRPHFAVLFRVRYGVEVLLVQIVNVFAKILDVHFDLLDIPFEAFALVDGLHQVGICLRRFANEIQKRRLGQYMYPCSL
jgi:hypothetical protein